MKLSKNIKNSLENNKNEKGITLIALVVTIVVLIILAAISLNTVIGEHGLIKSAQNATEKWKQAEEKEKNEIEDLMDIFNKIEVNNYTNNYINSTTGEVENKGKKLICVYTDLTDDDVWYQYKSNNMYDITGSGYTYKGVSYKKVYGYFIDNDVEFNESDIKKVKITKDENKAYNEEYKVTYREDKYNINNSPDTTDMKDIVAAVAVMSNDSQYYNYTDETGEEDEETVRKQRISNLKICFRADVNRDKKVDEVDKNLILQYVMDN